MTPAGPSSSVTRPASVARSSRPTSAASFVWAASGPAAASNRLPSDSATAVPAPSATACSAGRSSGAPTTTTAPGAWCLPRGTRAAANMKARPWIAATPDATPTSRACAHGGRAADVRGSPDPFPIMMIASAPFAVTTPDSGNSARYGAHQSSFWSRSSNVWASASRSSPETISGRRAAAIALGSSTRVAPASA